MAAYIRWQGKNRETGTVTQVVDNRHPEAEFDGEGDRWSAICMDHSRIVTTSTLETALSASAHPLSFCGVCNGSEQAEAERLTVESAKTVQVAVWGPNLGRGHGDEAMHVHSVGCADTRKGVYKGHKPWNIEVSSVQEVVEDIYGDMLDESEDSDWRDYAGDVRIFPCTGLA